MRRLLPLVLGLALVLTACTGPDEPTPTPTTPSASGTGGPACRGERGAGVNDATITPTVAGVKRTYYVHTPPSYGRKELPVVYLLHGLGGDAIQNAAYTQFPTAADQHGFVLVAPQGLPPRKGWDVETPVSSKGSDLAALKQMMVDVGKNWCVDTDRQFVAGLSNGSFAAFAMACDGSFPIKAYGGVAASFYDQGCDSAPPASFIYFHGTGDKSVPYDGGDTPVVPVRAAPRVLQDWADHDGCRSSSADAIGADVTERRWSGCRDSRLIMFTISGGGHTWPGSPYPIPVLGNTTKTIDATDEMVSFFGLDR